MTYEFEIRSVKWHHNRENFIFARHLGDSHEFNVPDGSLFGDVPIYHYTEMRSSRDKDDVHHFDIFKGKPNSFAHLAVALTISDSNAPGLMSLLSPVIRMVAKRAKKNGTEKWLLDRYCI